MRTASRRALLSVALVSGLVLGLVPAVAQVPSVNVGSVDVRNVLAGTANKEFKISITRRAAPAVNAVIIHIPPDYNVIEGRADGWNSQIITPRRVLFTGGSLAPAATQAFSIFANVPTPAQDVTHRWKATVSTNGGSNQDEVDPSGSGTMDTVTRVLQVTNLAVTAPAGATDGSVSGAQNNVQTSCAVQNVGSGTLSVDATLSGSNYQTSNPDAQSLAPGQTGSFVFGMSFDDVNSTTSTNAECIGESAGRASTGNREVFGRRINLSIQPRAVFDYVATSLSPKFAAPGARPVFSVRVNKHQKGASLTTLTDGSPAATLEPSCAHATPCSTDFAFDGIGPTPLGGPATIEAGKVDSVLLQFAPLLIPTPEAGGPGDGDHAVTINLGGTDANGAPISVRPVPNVLDTIKIDASIPVIQGSDLSGPPSRCCAEDPAVKNGDTLSFSAAVTDRNSATGQQEPCKTCQVVSSQLIQYATEDGKNEVGQRINVTVTNSGGALTGSYAGDYSPQALSVQMATVVKDEAGNLSNGGAPTFSDLFEVDNIAPTITAAAASPAPSIANQDLQRQLRVTFSEAVDNFTSPTDGVCPGPDWRADNNTVVNCTRDANFRGASLLVSNELPDDTPGFNLAYFPQTPLAFHDRTGNPIATGTTVKVQDLIPPKAPIVDEVAGEEAEDDGRFYTNNNNAPFLLSGAKAVKPGYTIQLWRENGLEDGLQTEGTNADAKIGQAVAQASTVTITPTSPLTHLDANGNAPQAGVEHTVYTRALDTAIPANPTPSDLIRAFEVVVDKVAPALSAAQAQVDRIHVDFNEAVEGTNSALFWELLDKSGYSVTLDQVTGSGSARDVLVDDAQYQAANAATIQYLYFGSPEGRYEDLAGNDVADKTIPTFASTP
ncbi:MAG TPA: hypothetical protein VG602_06295 [Actinomycetota bacterium]|nr:hypothetical protein [Actinomycetota bacterium]